ncbi:hypothetical protein LCGC14_3084590, partial [marine sediment metagenome]
PGKSTSIDGFGVSKNIAVLMFSGIFLDCSSISIELYLQILKSY